MPKPNDRNGFHSVLRGGGTSEFPQDQYIFAWEKVATFSVRLD
jgi:hypothetical protein